MILEQHRAQAGLARLLYRFDVIEVARHHRWSAVAVEIDRPDQQPFNCGRTRILVRSILVRLLHLFCTANFIHVVPLRSVL